LKVQLAARRLILLSASVVNFLWVAFSSSSVFCKTLAQSLRPSCFRPRDQAAIARDLVVFGGLRGVDQCRIQHRFVGDLSDDLIRFLDDAVDGRTVNCLRLGPVHLEHLFDALHVGFGLIEMGQDDREVVPVGKENVMMEHRNTAADEWLDPC
jgi:hypothetical protein